MYMLAKHRPIVKFQVQLDQFTTTLNKSNIEQIIASLEAEKEGLEQAIDDEALNCSTQTYYCCETSQNGTYYECETTPLYDELEEKLELTEKKLAIAYDY